MIELCIFVYVAGIRKKLLSHCSLICMFHLDLKHPLCSNLWIQTKRYDCYCPGLGTTKLPLFMQDLPWSPHVCMEFMESDLHPSVNQLRNIDLTASSPLVQPSRTLPPSALTSAIRTVCSCSPLPPKATFLPLTWALSKRPLPGQGSANVPDHHQGYQSAQDYDSFSLL